MAVIGTSEKGYETWEIAVRGTGGHSGMPPVDGSTGGRAGADVSSSWADILGERCCMPCWRVSDLQSIAQ